MSLNDIRRVIYEVANPNQSFDENIGINIYIEKSHMFEGRSEMDA